MKLLRHRIAAEVARIAGVAESSVLPLIAFHASRPSPTAAGPSSSTNAKKQASPSSGGQTMAGSHFRLSAAALAALKPASQPATREDDDPSATQASRDLESRTLSSQSQSPAVDKLTGGQLAARIQNELQTSSQAITSVATLGQLIQFGFHRPTFTKDVLHSALTQGSKYGEARSIGAGKTAVLDFSSPNIAKPFHAGHLRSAIIGNVLRNLLQAVGYKTVAINYLGDWGKQYGLLGVGFAKYGSQEKLASSPLQHLAEVYVKINREAETDPAIHDQARQHFRKMETGDPETLATWRQFKSLSEVEYRSMYARLNVQFDVYDGESLQHELVQQHVASLVDKLGVKTASEIAASQSDTTTNQALESPPVTLKREDNGALVALFANPQLKPTVLAKANESSTYLTRDIAAAVSRWQKYKPDLALYVVGPEQALHFEQLFELLRVLGYSEYAAACRHVAFGKVEGMSSRTGNMVLLSDVLEEGEQHMREIGEERGLARSERTATSSAESTDDASAADQLVDRARVSRSTALAAIVVQDLKSRRLRGYKFDWNQVLQTTGTTGPYLLYTHARLCSLKRKMGSNAVAADVDWSLLSEPSAMYIVDVVAAYPDAIVRAATQLEPSLLVDQLMDLALAVSAGLRDLRVKGASEEVARARLALFESARINLANGLCLLGLDPLEAM
ncbi:arginyl-tRNA synthetase [Capsaspora owczarzaki ATCC 30864]|uniref:arginyl-tRNA synthetase n=1 Tax=Capsaspora owczarzaki (strain ATCC 30864) TaxID=595528 RepID=UPI00035265BD|nr:arginyl-tRNA synthetase [Capsaspora owczarzaki ATCC 30864]|eukprot:XP_004364903.2 arginyl-tRNA synthetase [Capsaspora owczarzaki ATCC 30864]